LHSARNTCRVWSAWRRDSTGASDYTSEGAAPVYDGQLAAQQARKVSHQRRAQWTTSIDIYLRSTPSSVVDRNRSKIALVPFLEITAGIDGATKARIVRKMLVTAGVGAVILVVLGELLARLLHFSTGSLSIAGGIILIIIAVTMVLGVGDTEHSAAIEGRDPMQIAVFPLAIPYLLNPAGIVTLVTLSAEADSVAVFAMVLGLLAVVLALDVLVFRGANRVSDHLDESRMLVTEKVGPVWLVTPQGVKTRANAPDSVELSTRRH
jgi:multiple antibiotic resistance protein